MQRLAHEIAIDAVTNLNQGDVRITIRGPRFNTVDVGGRCIRFYAKHLSYTERGETWENWWGFDVEEKLYLTSNHKTKISFAAPEGKEKEHTATITKFIDKIMADVEPIPRFSLQKYANRKV